MAVYSNNTQDTLFQPNGDTLELVSYLEASPRFLFRIHAPKSSGETEATFVASTGAEQGHGDILHLPRLAASEMIGRHLISSVERTIT